MVEILGWIGAFLLGACGLPQVFKTWKTKSVGDLSWIFLLSWCFGEFFTLVYIWMNNITNPPLMTNYIVNLFVTIYLLTVKVERKN